jgi:tRNA threonylcarbamoyladenosine biosynthesis protein TsaB
VKILAIDTSGQQAGVAVVENGKALGKLIISAHTQAGGWKHSERLLPTIAQMLADAGLSLKNMNYIAYTCGPGSFTGLRIGAATALGLAKGAGLPVVQVPTLDAMAYNAIIQGENRVVPMMDARCGQVYAAVYERGENGKAERITEYLAAPVEEVRELAANALEITSGPDPVAVGLWAANNFGASSSEAELLYIRAPQAIREAAEKKC